MNEFQKIYLYLSLMALGILGLVIFVLYPSVSGIIVKQTDLSNFGRQISINAEVSSSTLQTGNEFEKQKAEVDLIYNKAIMTNSNQLNFLDFIENLAREEIRTQITFNPTEKMILKRSPVTPFEIRTMSSLSEFLNYLSEIESAEHYILVHDITIIPLRIPSQPEITTKGTIEGFIFLE